MFHKKKKPGKQKLVGQKVDLLFFHPTKECLQFLYAITALQYKDADYTRVDAAIAKANALNKNDYKDFSGVECAIRAVARGKNITQQAEVDAMAKAIEDALAALQYKDANKTTQPTPAPAATATPQYTIPQTGDTSNPALLVVLMLVSGSAAIGTAVVASKKKHNR